MSDMSKEARRRKGILNIHFPAISQEFLLRRSIIPNRYNRIMKYAVLLIASLFILTSCNTYQPTDGTELSASEAISQPTITPSSTKTPTKFEPTSTIPAIIVPTPTPHLYSVVINDTLTGIAYKFNVTLDELLNANPTIINQPLIVGQELIIPARNTSGATSTITPFPIEISQVNCIINKDESLTCMVLLENESNQWIQNMSALIQLIDPTGNELDSCTAFPLLDLLPPGKAVILSCSFLNPPKSDFQAYATITSAVNNPISSERYLNISIQNPLIEITWDGKSANVQGEIILNSPSLTAKRVWILAISFNQDGAVVGFRRWESTTTLSSGDVMPFELTVSALDSEIDRIELIAEGIKN